MRDENLLISQKIRHPVVSELLPFPEARPISGTAGGMATRPPLGRFASGACMKAR